MYAAAFEDKIEELKKSLEDMALKLQGMVEIAAVVTLEGLPITHFPEQLPEGVDNTRIAAMTAALLSLGERAMMEMGQGVLTRIFVEGDEGYLMSVQAGDQAVLTAAAKSSLKLGLLFHDMKKASKKIGEILDNPIEE